MAKQWKAKRKPHHNSNALKAHQLYVGVLLPLFGENTMKKIIILSSALCVLASYPANAGVAIVFNEPQPVYYAEPSRGYVMAPDWPSEHYDIHRYRHNDYWSHQKRNDNDRWEQNDGHDNGNHGHK